MPGAVRRFMRFPRTHDTNLDRLMGRVAIVTERISNPDSTGAVRLGDVVWTARSTDGSVIEEGEYVTFEGIEGNRALVKRKEG